MIILHELYMYTILMILELLFISEENLILNYIVHVYNYIQVYKSFYKMRGDVKLLKKALLLVQW